MTLSLHEQQILAGIEEDLTTADARLAARLASFGQSSRWRRVRHALRTLFRPARRRRADTGNDLRTGTDTGGSGNGRPEADGGSGGGMSSTA